MAKKYIEEIIDSKREMKKSTSKALKRNYDYFEHRDRRMELKNKRENRMGY